MVDLLLETRIDNLGLTIDEKDRLRDYYQARLPRVELKGVVEVEGFLGMEFSLRIPKGLLRFPEEADDLADQLRVGIRASLHHLRSKKFNTNILPPESRIDVF